MGLSSEKSLGIEFLPSILFHIKKRKRLQSPYSIVQKNIEIEQEEPINDEMKTFPQRT